jgi:hypothetical protein
MLNASLHHVIILQNNNSCKEKGAGGNQPQERKSWEQREKALFCAVPVIDDVRSQTEKPHRSHL